MRQDKKTGRTEFTHDGMDVIQDRFEKNDGSTSTTNYVNGIGIDDKLKVTSGTTSRYFLTDHLGSTVGMSDTNGNITESASYDSFGRTISSTLTTRYGYTGREADEKTGLMYYRARQYDPQIGRFTSEDPIGFTGGINSYSYVGNNPNDSIDPFGLQAGPVNPLRDTYGPEEWVANGINNTVSDLLFLDHFAKWAWTAGNHRCSWSTRGWAVAKAAGMTAFMAFGGQIISKIGGRLSGAISKIIGRGSGATPKLVHLTDAAGASGIQQSGQLVGRNGIFATPQSITTQSTAVKVLRTGLPPGRTTHAVNVPTAANSAFHQVLPLGPYSAMKYAGGVRFTAPGTINMATGTFTQTGSMARPLVAVYGPDVAAYGSITGAGTIAMANETDCECD